MTDQPPKGPVVYSLRNGTAHYIGATVDLDRRIEQHNASRVGGAHRTAKRGPGWRCTWYVDGFSSFQTVVEAVLNSVTNTLSCPEPRCTIVALPIRRAFSFFEDCRKHIFVATGH